LISPEDCQSLIKFHLTHNHLRTVGDGTDYRAIDYVHVQSQWVRDIFNRVSHICTSHIFKETGQYFYPEMMALNEWGIGGIQNPHFDTYSNAEVAHDTVPQEGNSREWTCILYLNDDYRGGETYFPPSETFPIGHTHQPAPAEGLLFQGLYLEHGVSAVRRGPRHTISLWFTDIEDKIILDDRVRLDEHQLDVRKRQRTQPR